LFFSLSLNKKCSSPLAKFPASDISDQTQAESNSGSTDLNHEETPKTPQTINKSDQNFDSKTNTINNVTSTTTTTTTNSISSSTTTTTTTATTNNNINDTNDNAPTDFYSIKI
jgi:hypothetical protein